MSAKRMSTPTRKSLTSPSSTTPIATPQYWGHYHKNFIQPYGQAYLEDMSPATFDKKLLPFNFSTINKPKVGFSCLGDTVPTTLQHICDNLPKLTKHLQTFCANMEEVLPSFAALNEKNKDTALTESDVDQVFTFLEEMESNWNRRFVSMMYEVGASMTSLSLSLLSHSYLVNNPDDWAKKVQQPSPMSFQATGNMEIIKRSLLNSTPSNTPARRKSTKSLSDSDSSPERSLRQRRHDATRRLIPLDEEEQSTSISQLLTPRKRLLCDDPSDDVFLRTPSAKKKRTSSSASITQSPLLVSSRTTVPETPQPQSAKKKKKRKQAEDSDDSPVVLSKKKKKKQSP